MTELLLVLFAIYVFQILLIFVVLVAEGKDVYKTKKEVYRDLIPFCWVWWAVKSIIKAIKDSWNELE